MKQLDSGSIDGHLCLDKVLMEVEGLSNFMCKLPGFTCKQAGG